MNRTNKISPCNGMLIVARLPITLRHVLPAVLATCLSMWSGHASASQALAQKYACVACHQAALKVVGPSWKDIGAKYGSGKGTAAQLAASIKSGSSGKWGPVPMPAQTRVPDADLQALALWLLNGAK